MRQFYLENEYGQKYELNNVQTGFLKNPSGLGYAMDASYTKLGSVWVRNKFDDAQATISGEVAFATSSPYEAASEFFQYIRRSSELILHRITPAGEYLKDVDLTSVEVGEIGDGNMLSVPVSFICKTLWYEKVARRYVLDVTGSGSIMRYSYRLSARFKDAASGKITLNNDGSVPAPFTVVMQGVITNPVMTLSQNGSALYSVAITADATSSQSIEWSSKDDDLYCEKVSGSTRTSLVQNLSISNTNFFKAPVGESVITFTADSTIVSPITVVMYKQFRAV